MNIRKMDSKEYVVLHCIQKQDIQNNCDIAPFIKSSKVLGSIPRTHLNIVFSIVKSTDIKLQRQEQPVLQAS